MNPWVRLLRPGNGAISFVGTVVGGLAATGVSGGHLTTELLLLVLAGATTFLATSGGNVLNDYLDREGDKKNHPDRPLPKGEVRPGQVRIYAGGLFVASGIPLALLALTGQLTPGWSGYAFPFAIWAFAVALLLTYELRWKAHGLLGNASVGLLTGAVFLFGASVVGSTLLVVPLAGMATLSTLSREIIKDMEDAEGDVDRQTLPRVRGMPAASLAARVSVVAAVLLSPLPTLTWLPLEKVVRGVDCASSLWVSCPLSSWAAPSPAGIIYLAFVAAADIVFVLSVKDLPGRLHREQSLSKLAMVIALVGFLGAALR